MEPKKVETGAISSERLQKAFDKYFKTRTNEQIVTDLAESSPELLMHFNARALKNAETKK